MVLTVSSTITEFILSLLLTLTGQDYKPCQIMYNATYARNGKFDNSSISEEEPDDDFGNTHTDFDECIQNGLNDTNGQCSTALSKLQIRLNDVINRHKAPLVIYDEIVHLINDYISSDNFSKYGKLKTRQSSIIYKTDGNDSSNCKCIEAGDKTSHPT